MDLENQTEERQTRAQERLAPIVIKQQADQGQQARVEAERRAQGLAERLRAMGIDPDRL